MMGTCTIPGTDRRVPALKVGSEGAAGLNAKSAMVKGILNANTAATAGAAVLTVPYAKVRGNTLIVTVREYGASKLAIFLPD